MREGIEEGWYGGEGTEGEGTEIGDSYWRGGQR